MKIDFAIETLKRQLRHEEYMLEESKTSGVHKIFQEVYQELVDELTEAIKILNGVKNSEAGAEEND